MQNQKKDINHCIRCDVEECAHHAGSSDHCTLNAIQVEKHEQTADKCQCTDCASFECRSSM